MRNIEIYGGLFLILWSLAIFIFPPKFGNFFFGVCTKGTMKNALAWANGQKLFAVSTLIIGIIFLGLGSFIKINEPNHPFFFVLLLIGLWNISKYLVNKYLENKYPDF